MTIDELLAITGLTESDEIPVWDAEATGEPTKKITAANLAAAMVALANLVTGVKGNSESSYRHGNVNITPANIGALPDTTSIPSKTSDLTNDSGFLTSSTGVTGVKGNAESSYRQGNVNLSPDNLGALQREIAATSISDLNNTSLTGHATLNSSEKANLPPGMTSGAKLYSVYLFGSVQMAIGYTENGALWVRAYGNNTWGSWHLVGGCTITGQATASSATIDYQEIRRNGNVVTLCMRLHLTADVAATGGLLCTLPDGFKPTNSVKIYIMTDLGSFDSALSYHYSASVDTNGNITTSIGSGTLASGKYVIIDTTFII